MSALHDPRFVGLVLGGSAVSMIAFLLFALPLTALAARDPAWARARRIQKRAPDVARWFWPSVGRWALNNAVLTVGLVATWPLWQGLVHVRTEGWPTWWELLGSLVFFTYLDDALYYVMHRTLHHKALYRHVHAVHHRVVTPSAITGHYMHPVEFVLTAGLMLVGPLLLHSHVVTAWAWIALRQWEAAEGHCGYRLPFGLTHLFPGADGAVPHDFHHSKVHGNYAGFLGWLDGLLGTRIPAYADDLARRHTPTETS